MLKTGTRRDTTAADWEALARLDPYWAVLSNTIYRRENLSQEHITTFLKTGEAHVDELWRIWRQVDGEEFRPARLLDFGCGVGRVTLPLARRGESVVAVDVAEQMLSLTRSLLDQHGVRNVQLVKSDATLSGVQGPFDLVHSVLVLQHVPQGRGLWLITRLVELAGDRGAVALHILYDNPRRPSRPMRFAHRVARPLKALLGRRPEIQMNPYPLNEVFKIIQDAGVARIHVELTNHAGHLGAMLFFRKASTA